MDETRAADTGRATLRATSAYARGASVSARPPQPLLWTIGERRGRSGADGRNPLDAGARRLEGRTLGARPQRAQLEATRGQGCYLFSLDPMRADATAFARFFNPTVGIWEDPATGSAGGPLACHLIAGGVVADGSTVLIEQGHAMGRPSLLRVEVDGRRVGLGGAGVVLADGSLRSDDVAVTGAGSP